MRFRFGKAALALLALALLGGPAAAQVPDPYARQLAQQLARAEQIVARQGFFRAAGPFAGDMAQRETRRYTVTLRAGLDYRVVGVCDARCSDLNLRAYDPNNTFLAQDELADDTPVLAIRPSITGRHTIEVSMARCTDSSCWFAFNVYGR